MWPIVCRLASYKDSLTIENVDTPWTFWCWSTVHKRLNGAVSVYYTQTQFDNGMKSIARQRAAGMGEALGDKNAGVDRLMFVKARR